VATRITTPETLFTTTEAAEYMGFQEDTVRQYLHRGMMKAKKAGPIYLVTKSECDHYLREKNRVGNPGNRRAS